MPSGNETSARREKNTCCWPVKIMSSSAESSDDDDDDSEPVYSGKRNSEGQPHGRGSQEWPNSNRFEGHFQMGKKEGRGCFYFSDGSTLSGMYKDGLLEGCGLYCYPDGRYLQAEYSQGDMNGKFTEYAPDGTIISRGCHRDNVRIGWLQEFDDFGGSVMGRTNEDGVLSGTGIAYVYPDKQTALVGEFNDGELVKAKAAVLETNMETFPPKFKFLTNSPIEFLYDESSRDCISNYPLLPDPYEQWRVYVTQSTIPNAGEGLFARKDLLEGEVASFYNGIRLTHEEVDSRDWSRNQNTISLDDDTVIDVPEEYCTLDKYCASLGHKANHSNSPNCEYKPFHHPRFGFTKYLLVASFPGLSSQAFIACSMKSDKSLGTRLSACLY